MNETTKQMMKAIETVTAWVESTGAYDHEIVSVKRSSQSFVIEISEIAPGGEKDEPYMVLVYNDLVKPLAWHRLK